MSYLTGSGASDDLVVSSYLIMNEASSVVRVVGVRMGAMGKGYWNGSG